MSKVFTDCELKQYLKDKQINIIKTILHPFGVGSRKGVCITCDYYVSRCWLCDQCEECCNWSEKQREIEECFLEDKKQEKVFNHK